MQDTSALEADDVLGEQSSDEEDSMEDSASDDTFTGRDRPRWAEDYSCEGGDSLNAEPGPSVLAHLKVSWRRPLSLGPVPAHRQMSGHRSQSGGLTATDDPTAHRRMCWCRCPRLCLLTRRGSGPRRNGEPKWQRREVGSCSCGYGCWVLRYGGRRSTPRTTTVPAQRPVGAGCRVHCGG